jgi:hypothetical protein
MVVVPAHAPAGASPVRRWRTRGCVACWRPTRWAFTGSLCGACAFELKCAHRLAGIRQAGRNRPGASWDDSPVGVTDAVAGSAIDRLQRELDRLRVENARLTRLLDLRGQGTAAPHEQLAVPAPDLVTMASSTQDKLALYADRFRARTDVHAVRWGEPPDRTGGVDAVEGPAQEEPTAVIDAWVTVSVRCPMCGRRRPHRSW